MKTDIIKILLLSAIVSTMAGCKNDDISFPDYDYRTVYFAYQTPVRTIILGEDPESDNTIDNEHACRILATTGGGYSNPGKVVVRYAIDDMMLDNLYFAGSGEKILPMPSAYYTLASDQFEISKGQITGAIRVQLTDAFFADTHSLENHYVIPLRMTHVEGGDSILRGTPAVESPSRFVSSDWTIQPKDYILYCVKYINPWHGHYLRRGSDEIIGTSGHESLSGVVRRHAEYIEKDEQVMLSSSAYKSVTMNLNAKDESGVNIPYTISINFNDGDEGDCTVSAPAGSKYSVAGSGRFVKRGDKNSWGGKDRDVLYLDYTVNLPQLTCHTADTLVMHYRGVIKEEFSIEIR